MPNALQSPPRTLPLSWSAPLYDQLQTLRAELRARGLRVVRGPRYGEAVTNGEQVAA